MKNSGGNKFLIVIAFLAISLLAANAFILNSDMSAAYTPRIVKSILNYQKNENTSPKNVSNSVKISGEENAKRATDDADDNAVDRADVILDGTSHDDRTVVPGDTQDEFPESQEDFLGGTQDEFSDVREAHPDDVKDDEYGSAFVSDTQYDPVAVGAHGKVLIEQSTCRVLYGENEHEKCYPASTTKILTAYIAIKTLPLDMIISVPKEAAGVEGSSIYLKAGDRISVEDLLYGMMLRSGNDAATALAIASQGSVQAFADFMNETAKRLGAKDSHFVNPHGLHDDGHYTTAYDLALITAAAYKSATFRRIASATIRRIKINDSVVAIGNKNKLLKLYDGANGAKTGYTKRSGRCLVGGARRENMQLISVVFNCPDMWNDTISLLERGFSQYDMVPLELALLRDSEGKRPVYIGNVAPVTPNWQDVYYPLADDEYISFSTQ